MTVSQMLLTLTLPCYDIIAVPWLIVLPIGKIYLAVEQHCYSGGNLKKIPKFCTRLQGPLSAQRGSKHGVVPLDITPQNYFQFRPRSFGNGILRIL